MPTEKNQAAGFGFNFAFCPDCGQKLPSLPASNPLECPACGFTLYRNVAAAVCALITKGRKLLATVRRNPPAAGKLDLPGGFVDPQETAEQALARELKEELGLKIISCRYFATRPNVYSCRGITYRTLDLAFVCTVNGLEAIRCADDVADFCWLNLAKIDPAGFGLESIRSFVAQFAAGMAGK